MKRMLLACLMCAALGAVALIPASASANSYPAPHKQRVIGAGFLSPFDPGEFVNFFAIDLSANADGSNPQGAATVIGYIGSGTQKGLHAFAGTPVCLKTDSSGAATFVLKFFASTGIDGIVGARFWVQDNGNPSSLNNPVDQIIDDRYNAAQLSRANCDSTTPPRAQHTIAKGDTVVIN